MTGVKIIVTGMNGTVAPVLAQHLRSQHHSVAAWDRHVVPPEDDRAVEDHVGSIRPHAIFHLATGSPGWAETLARSAAALDAVFIYTSSVSVFGPDQQGPFATDAEPNPMDDYGRYKLECERRVLAANPAAYVIRFGWQIGHAPGSNNMVDYLTRAQQTHGRVEASESWLPACSFLEDTAAGLAELLASKPASGIYHFEGNPGLSFFEIASRLNRRYGDPWNLIRTASPSQDQRLAAAPTWVMAITDRLPEMA